MLPEPEPEPESESESELELESVLVPELPVQIFFLLQLFVEFFHLQLRLAPRLLQH